MHGSFKKMLKESIHESQKCQRNWNLDESISLEDKELILEAATNSPSKQNLNYFKLHVIEDRDLIEKIHENTKGFGPIYKNFDGWKSSTMGIKKFDDLPKNAKKYVLEVEKFIETKISSISTSPERNDTILIEDPFNI